MMQIKALLISAAIVALFAGHGVVVAHAKVPTATVERIDHAVPPFVAMPVFVFIGGAEVHSWSFVAQTNANNASITGPGGCQVGDLAILFDGATNTSGTSVPTNVIPAGWTQIVTTALPTAGTDAEIRATISYKILEAGDLTAGTMNAVTGMAATTAPRKIMSVFRSTNPITSIAVNSVQQEGNDGGNITPQIIPTAAATQAALCIAHSRASGTHTLTAAGMTATAGSSAAHQWAYRIFNSSPADQSVDTSAAADAQILQTFFIY